MARRSVVVGLSCAAVLAAGLWLGEATVGQPAPRDNPAVPRRVSYELGEQLFLHETFTGNGRTCATCHDPGHEFTVSPELARRRYEVDPDDPLFRPLDSDDGTGADYTTLLTHAVFRVTIPLHPKVSVVDEPQRRTITVWRGVPSISNVALTAPYLQDGRAANLADQARGAILDHMEPDRDPLTRDLAALQAFMTEQYYPLRLRALDDPPGSVPLEPGFSLRVESPAAQAGQASFDLRCRRCHGGELGQQPISPDLPQFANVFVSDRNAPGFPVLRLAFRLEDGSVAVAYTPDPGRAALTGDLLDLNTFDTPSLRGLKHTAPYFHDNSAATLQQVIEHYDDHFQMHMSTGEREDLLTYLELL